MTNKVVARLVLILSVALLALPRSAVAAPLVVGTGTPESCTEAVLQEALTMAGLVGGGHIIFRCGAEPVTIRVTQGTPLHPEDPEGERIGLRPPNDTTIDGGGLITLVFPLFQQSSRVGVVVDANTTVTLRGLKFDNNNFTLSIHNAGMLTISESTLSNNTSFNIAWGSTIANTGTLTIKDSVISNNRSPVAGALWNFGIATIQNSTFSDNTGEDWGAIINEGTLTVKTCVFVNNGGGYMGGAIDNSPFATLTIKDSVFSENRASMTGVGGVRNGGVATIDNSSFSDNVGTHGGAISNGGTLTVNHSDFSGNSAERNGGGVYNAGTGTIKDSNFSGNSAEYGGGIANNGALTVKNSAITNNTAGITGGGIYTYGGTMELKSTSVTGNTPDNIVTVP